MSCGASVYFWRCENVQNHNPTGETILTEKVNYIRVHKSGVYLLTDVNHAEGVAYHGTPYLFADCAQVHEVDGADELRRLSSENESLREQFVNAEEALIELYESMEVANNG